MTYEEREKLVKQLRKDKRAKIRKQMNKYKNNRSITIRIKRENP